MTTCSDLRAQIGEPLAGSAPHARLWILIEQPGPWGRDALLQSHLPLEVGRALAALADGLPVRIGLIRAVGAHADLPGASRSLLVARTDRSASWLTSRTLTDVTGLAHDLDVAALLSADHAPSDLPGDPMPTPGRALLVCTNAKRDQCCAVLGRPLAAAFAEGMEGRSRVWETSHTSGHRFAPTFVSLPDGFLFGGPEAASFGVDACRGRSSLPAAAQVAELAVLRRLGAPVPRPLDVHALGSSTPEHSTWTVVDGDQSFTVDVTRTRSADRPESCGKGPVAAHTLTATVR